MAASSSLFSKLGWSHFPVDGNTKAPLVRWKTFTERRPTHWDAARWGELELDKAGIAVVTGPVSGLLVLDADGKEGAAEAEHRGLPETPMVRTPRGGLHVYFQCDQALKNTAHRGASKLLDVRCSNGYVVAPHTKRADGKKYTWMKSPEKVQLAPIPDWVLQMVKPVNEVRAKKSTPSTKILRLPPSIQALVEEDVDVGFRSERDFKVIATLIAMGHELEEIKDLAEAHPDGFGSKYLEQGEGYIERTIESVSMHLRDVTVKYCDFTGYEFGARIHVCFVDQENGRIYRSGVTVPKGKSGGMFERWVCFWEAVGLPIPEGETDVVKTCRAAIGKRTRIAVRPRLDGRAPPDNPVAYFFPVRNT